MSLSPLIANYEHVLLDLDGTVWVGDVATAGAGEALAALRGAEKTIAFVTNDSARAPEDYVRKLWSLGLRASVGEVVSVGSALQYFLAQRPVPVTDVRDRLARRLPPRCRRRPADRQRHAAGSRGGPGRGRRARRL